MKTAFLITSFWAYGELLIAMEFAKNLCRHGQEVHFIIPPTHIDNVKINGFTYSSLVPKSRKLNQIIFNEVEKNFKPDVLILSDFLNYNFADVHYGVKTTDLDIFTGKRATFDNFDWCKERRCMDTYGFISTIPSKIDMDSYGSRIIPCPLGNCDEQNVGEYRYALIDEYLDTSSTNRMRLRQLLGFKWDEEIILVSFAQWQKGNIAKKSIQNFISLSNELFEELIIKLSAKYTVLCIGKNLEHLDKLPGIQCFDSMPTVKFEEYAAISDLYIGRNLTSTSMVKLAMSKVLCMSIMNSSSSKNEEIFNYKYSMYPVGWYEFLKPLFKDNLYDEIIIKSEQFQMDETVCFIDEIFTTGLIRSELFKKVDILKDKLAKLPSPYRIVHNIMDM